MSCSFDNIETFILSGGQATRAGGINKSLMLVDGRRIIDQQLERLLPTFANRITIVTDRTEDYVEYNLPCVPDLHFGGEAEKTSLRGVASALTHAKSDWIFLLASDMPWPDLELVQKMCAGMKDDGSVALLGLRNLENNPQPFHTLLSKQLAASAIETLHGDDLALQSWMSKCPSRFFSAAEMQVPAEKVLCALENFNSPPEPQTGIA